MKGLNLRPFSWRYPQGYLPHYPQRSLQHYLQHYPQRSLQHDLQHYPQPSRYSCRPLSPISSSPSSPLSFSCSHRCHHPCGRRLRVGMPRFAPRLCRDALRGHISVKKISSSPLKAPSPAPLTRSASSFGEGVAPSPLTGGPTKACHFHRQPGHDLQLSPRSASRRE